MDTVVPYPRTLAVMHRSANSPARDEHHIVSVCDSQLKESQNGSIMLHGDHANLIGNLRQLEAESTGHAWSVTGMKTR